MSAGCCDGNNGGGGDDGICKTFTSREREKKGGGGCWVQMWLRLGGRGGEQLESYVEWVVNIFPNFSLVFGTVEMEMEMGWDTV